MSCFPAALLLSAPAMVVFIAPVTVRPMASFVVMATAAAVSDETPAVSRLILTARVVWLPPTAKLDAPSVVHLIAPGVMTV